MFDESVTKLIAEIGGNHEGDFGYAEALVLEAIESEADVIKLQAYTGDRLVNAMVSPARNRHFKKFELTLDQHLKLASLVKANNRIYSASIWDFESLIALDEFLDFYKIGSGDLTYYPMLDALAERGKPILLSTGLSSFHEVEMAVDRIRAVNPKYWMPKNLCVMQCTSMYPIPRSEANLQVMNQFKSSLNVSVGYSDHTEDMEALEVAASMGACMLEFHFTDCRVDREFRDHQVSLLADEVRSLRRKIEIIRELKGSSVKAPTFSEIENGHVTSFRRAVYLQNGKKCGDIISFEDLVFLRPANGTDARDFESVVGAIAMRDLKPLEVLVRDLDYKPFSQKATK